MYLLGILPGILNLKFFWQSLGKTRDIDFNIIPWSVGLKRKKNPKLIILNF